MKVVAFNGSARKKGNTATMLRAVLGELDWAGIETELVSLADYKLAGCNACMKCAKNKDRRCAVDDGDMNDMIARMIDADGIILGSPTYFADVSTSMKALIERCGMVSRVNGDLLRHKAGAAVVAMRRGGAAHVFSSMNYFFLIGQMIVVGSSYWNIGIGLKPGEVSGDEEGMRTMTDLGRNMAWLLPRLSDR